MGNDIKEKLENELPYRPYSIKSDFSFVLFIFVALLFLLVFIAYLIFHEKDKVGIICMVILTTFFVLTICSFIFYTITLIKDDCGIRFAKLNELARISEKNDINTKNKKNCKCELYKKYMDTLADI